MEEVINLVYIDDVPDVFFSEYLDCLEKDNTKGYELKCKDIEFKAEDGCDSLLKDERIQAANILVVDSMLFEHNTATSSKFTGEELKIILQKLYPFIEVILISQNEMDSRIRAIAKYKYNTQECGNDYYSRIATKYINEAANEILQYRVLAGKMNENKAWGKYLKEKVLDALNGTQVYDELTKKDIDALVDAFKKLKESIYDK